MITILESFSMGQRSRNENACDTVSPPLLQSHVRQRSPDVHVVPGASMMFLVAGSFLGGVVTGSLSFFRLLYGTKRRTGPVCPVQERRRRDR